jgi:site-specific recombinase XerD
VPKRAAPPSGSVRDPSESAAPREDSPLPGADLLDQYLRSLMLERNLSAFTLRNYRSDVSAFLEWLRPRKIAPAAVTRLIFREYLGSLNAARAARASVTRKVSTIHAFYRHLHREGVLPRDLLDGVRPPRRERRLPSLLAEEQAATVVEMPDDDRPMALRDRAILELLYGAGVRVSELAGLNVRDVDADNWSIRVTAKGNKERIALYGRPAAEAMERYQSHGRPALLRKATDALFLNNRGGRLSVRAIELLVQRYAELAGVNRRVYPHLFRHSFATHLLDGGADVRIVQELLGHESAGTTQIYTHVTEERQRQVYTEAFYNQWHPRSQRRQSERLPPTRENRD